MKAAVIVAALVLAGARHLPAQSHHLDATSALIGMTVHDRTILRPGFTSPRTEPLPPSLRAEAAVGDSILPKHHFVRNGAMIGAGIGFVAGAIGGGILSDGCVNCSKGRIAVGYVGGVGATGALAGAILGSITGQLIKWTGR